MDQLLREEVRRRAGDCCEYCRLPQAASLLSFHVDHIIAKQHLDEIVDEAQFLCLACSRCNAYRGTNLSSIDPVTQQLVSLYHPRQEKWEDHFQIRGGEVVGLTASGRATARLLNMNAPQRVELREQWFVNDESD